MKSLLLLSALVLSLGACTQTQIGGEFHPGIAMSAEKSVTTIATSSLPHGATTDVTVALKDQNGAAYLVSGSTISFTLTGGTSTGTFSSVTARGDGSYSATFTAGVAGSAVSIQASVDGKPLKISSTTLQVVASGSSFTQTWDFTANASYEYDSSKIDFSAGVCRLSGVSANVTDSFANDFASGTQVGLVADSTNHYLLLDRTPATAANTTALDSTWAPKYSNIDWYWNMNGTGSVPSSVTPTKGAGTINYWNSSLAYGPGKVGTGVYLAGNVATGFSIMSSPIVNISDKITVGGWMKYSGPADAWAMMVTTSLNPGWGLQRNASTNNLFFLMTTSAGSYNVGLTKMPVLDGNWHHVMFTAGLPDATTHIGSLDAYMDGIAVDHSTYTAGAGFANTGSPYFKAPAVAGASSWVDEWAIWHEELSPSEIKNIYDRQVSRYSGKFNSRVINGASGLKTGLSGLGFKTTLPFLKELPDAACTTATCAHANSESSSDYSSLVGSTNSTSDNNLMSGIVGLWHFDEPVTASGANSIKDDSGKGNHGTPSSMTMGKPGKLSTAATFGSNKSIDVTLGNGLGGMTELTVSFWLRPDALPGTTGSTKAYLIRDFVYNGTNNAGPFMIFQEGDTVFAGVSNGTGTETYVISNPLVVGQWVHLLVKWDGTDLVMYQNGISVNTQHGPIAALDAFRGHLTFNSYYEGGTYYYQNFVGAMDEVAIWNRALKSGEINEVYRRGSNRLLFQGRACSAADCSDDATEANWRGPDGTNQTFFSELNNNSIATTSQGDVLKTPASLDLTKFTNPSTGQPYVQYRAYFESDDATTNCSGTWCSPELQTASAGTTRYNENAPSVVGKIGGYFASNSSFAETLGTNSCAGGVTYQLGFGTSSSNAIWYWWNSAKAADCTTAGTGAWCIAASDANSNAATVTTAHVSTFHTLVGSGSVFFKAFLHSDGGKACELDQLDLIGIQ